MNGATSFGGEDMQPLKEAHLTCERLKPFLSPPVFQQASAATHIAVSGLNRMLDDMRHAMVAPLPIRIATLSKACDDARASTLSSYQAALQNLEPLLKSETPLPGSTINISGPVYGQLNVAGNDVCNATMSLKIGDLIAKIDASGASEPERNEAKSRLNALLSHPLVAAIVGGLAGGIAA